MADFVKGLVINLKDLIDKLERERILSSDEFVKLLSSINKESSEYLFTKSRRIAKQYYGNKVYIRGLIEFTNFCKNDCYYCGIRKSNLNSTRYRLTKKEILECCKSGYSLGFRTFVLQGGEDGYFTDKILIDIISSIKSEYPDCAITLSIGERSYASYKALYEAGVNRYLLRHETATSSHYSALHPSNLTLSARQDCLLSLKQIGYQVGSGFMVGSPFQTNENLAADLLFLHELMPQMVGIGPFIPHKDTPFSDKTAGTADKTLFIIGMLRLMFPNILIPATTALGTINNTGRERGILAGANVVMPNLSPIAVRKKYMLYNNKISTNEEAAEGICALKNRMATIGYEVAIERGDCKKLMD